MAQGTFTLFNEFASDLGNKVHDFDTDAFKVALITTLPSASQGTPALGDFTEVTGTGYTAGGIALTCTYTVSGNVATFDSSTNPTWAQNGAGPNNIKAAVIYNSTDASKRAIGYVDMTADGGTTPVSLQNGDITITWNASGIFTVTV